MEKIIKTENATKLWLWPTGRDQLIQRTVKTDDVRTVRTKSLSECRPKRINREPLLDWFQSTFDCQNFREMTFSNAVANYLPDSIPHKLHDEKWKLFACSFFPMTAIDVDDSGQVLRSAVLVRSPLCVHDQVALPHVLRSCVSTRNCFTLLARLRLLCVCAYRCISLSRMQNSRLGSRPARHHQHALTAAATETERPIQRTRWELRNDTNSSLKNHKTPFQLQAARLPTATRSARK